MFEAERFGVKFSDRTTLNQYVSGSRHKILGEDVLPFIE